MSLSVTSVILDRWQTERDVQLHDRVVRVRYAGEREGSAIMYFHGTLGSLATTDDEGCR